MDEPAAGLAACAARAPGPPTGTKHVVIRQASLKFLVHPPHRRGDVPPSPRYTSIIGYRVLDAAGEKRLGRVSAV